MNTKRKGLKGPPERNYSIVRPGGEVALPAGFANLKLGQRVYFYIGRAEVLLVSRPRGMHRGRLLSARLRRSVRSLATYGPRARHEEACSDTARWHCSASMSRR